MGSPGGFKQPHGLFCRAVRACPCGTGINSSREPESSQVVCHSSSYLVAAADAERLCSYFTKCALMCANQSLSAIPSKYWSKSRTIAKAVPEPSVFHFKSPSPDLEDKAYSGQIEQERCQRMLPNSTKF